MDDVCIVDADGQPWVLAGAAGRAILARDREIARLRRLLRWKVRRALKQKTPPKRGL